MLHDIINEQGHFLNVRDGLSEKILFHMFSSKSLASIASILGIIVVADI